MHFKPNYAFSAARTRHKLELDKKTIIMMTRTRTMMSSQRLSSQRLSSQRLSSQRMAMKTEGRMKTPVMTTMKKTKETSL